jgi:reactive intermediate/imine deaminase
MKRVVTVAIVAIPVLLAAQARAPQVRRINPPAISAPTGYAHVVEVIGPGRTIYLSGQIALDQRGNVIGAGDMKAQTEQVFRNLEAALASVGASFKDVVKTNTYVTDISQLPVLRDMRAKYFGTATPTSTTVEVSKLALPGLMVEIEAVAVVAQ